VDRALAFGPTFEKASAAHPDIVFGKVDTEAEQSLAGSAGITSIPALMVFTTRSPQQPCPE
jgi:thioredoxin 1